MWRFKEKPLDTTLERLVKAINLFNGCSLVSTSNSRYHEVSLPFYTDFKFYTFVDFSFVPYLEVQLLDNVNRTIVLDGTQTPFLEANSISPLVLTNHNVYQYTLLVLGNTRKNDSAYRLVNSVDEICFSAIPTREQYEQIESSIISPRIKNYNGNFRINTTLLFDDNVIEALINVTIDGRVEIIEEKILLKNMPIKELVLD